MHKTLCQYPNLTGELDRTTKYTFWFSGYEKSVILQGYISTPIVEVQK